MKDPQRLVNVLVRGSYDGVRMQIADTDYAAPTIEWLESVAKRYHRIMRFLKITRWLKHFDCDDHASCFRLLCHLTYARTKIEGKRPEGVAVGEIWYVQDGGSGHAINTALVDKGNGTFDRIYIEPQAAAFKGKLKILKLSEKELKSRFHGRF